jgi:hypothetical protein
MRASRVMMKDVVQVPLTEYANQILYPYRPGLGVVPRMIHSVYTKFYLSQAKGYFPDFLPKEFPKIAEDVYGEVYQLIKGRKRGELMKFMTPPLVDMVRSSIKYNKPLPFSVFKQFETGNIVHARVSADSDLNSPKVNFLHLTLKFTCGELAQHVTFERRLDNKFKDSWRVCFIEEDLKKVST